MGEEVPGSGLRNDRASATDDLRPTGGVGTLIEEVFRAEWGRAVAIIAQATGDLDRAEDAVQDAFATALTHWPRDGVPRNPGAWIITTARNRAIDRIRRERTHARALEELEGLARFDAAADQTDTMTIPDERLALIFTCCHPALGLDARVALTLRLVGGLTTEEIARAFLTSEPAMAQRIVRAKRRVRDAGIPIRVPHDTALTDRLDGVLAVIYLIFNQGYSDTAARRELATEALQLGRLLAALMPDEPEVLGLLALMLLHDSRRHTRIGDDGAILLLEEQDRSRWDAAAIAQGVSLLDRALAHRSPGRYQLGAAIAALHAEAPSSDETDWPQIALLYERLGALHPSPVTALNHAVAVAMADGPDVGLLVVDGLADELGGYYLFHSTRADLLRRLERPDDARDAYSTAVALAPSDAERAFLRRRLAELPGSGRPV
jgi:RNA polymerase sigma-70 factor (ECF subfamily)